MTPQMVLAIGQQSLEVMLMVAGPLLLAGLAVGLVISVLQAATQINEATLSFIPKLLAMMAVLVIAGPWMLGMLVEFMRRLYESIPAVIG